MYEILKAIAAVQTGDPAADQFGFMYARRDFQNLYNELEPNKPVIVLDPVVIDSNFSEMGVVESVVYSGSFMILMSSDIDETDYDYRYQNYIKPLLTGALLTIKASLICDYPSTIEVWRTTEVINVLDYNFDGILINYRILRDA